MIVFGSFAAIVSFVMESVLIILRYMAIVSLTLLFLLVLFNRKITLIINNRSK